MAQQIEEEGNGRRDYFWVKIVVGLVLVTVASILISKLVVPRISDALGGKNRPAVTEKNNSGMSVFEETGKMVKGLENHENNKESGAKKRKEEKNAPGLTEEESAGRQPETEPSKTDVSIEKVEPEKVESVSIVTEKKAEKKKEPEVKKVAEEKPVVVKKTEKEPVKPVVSQKPVPQAVDKKEAAKPKPVATQPKPAEPAKDAPQAKPKEVPEAGNTKNSVYVLQLGNFTSQENADRMKKILVDQYKLEVYIKKIQYEGQTRFRVQAGAFKDKANAQKLARELQVKGYNSYIAETAAGQ
jgi:cell division protein FtsN